MNNFTVPEAFTNSTTQPFAQITSLEMCVYIFIVLFGLSTNSYVIWLIITATGITSEFFFLNLTVCEILICLNCFVIVLSSCFSDLIKLILFFQGSIVTGRPLFQCLICVERYLAVVHPVTFLKYKPLRYRLMCCTAVWIITLTSCLCCMFLTLTDIYTCFFLVQFLIFFSIQLFCCVAVLRALKQSGPGERGREREEENHMKKRAFHLILITTVSMFVTYVPYIIDAISVILISPFIYGFWVTGLICYALASFVQPVLYLHRAGKLSCLSPP